MFPSIRRGLAAAALLGIAGTGSCGEAPASEDPDVVTVLQASVSVGDPHIASDSSDRLGILFSIYEALVKLDSAGSFQPSLAESWETGPEARSWKATAERRTSRWSTPARSRPHWR